jgi:hypothetical protein
MMVATENSLDAECYLYKRTMERADALEVTLELVTISPTDPQDVAKIALTWEQFAHLEAHGVRVVESNPK